MYGKKDVDGIKPVVTPWLKAEEDLVERETCMKHQKSKKNCKTLDFLSSSTTKFFLNVSYSFNRDIAGHPVAVTGGPGLRDEVIADVHCYKAM